MILLNGIPSDFLPVTDRGLCYGDGVFRTLAVRSGKPQHLPSHLTKLYDDCNAISIRPPDNDLLVREIHAVIADETDCIVKIIVTRGLGARGYRIAEPVVPNRVVQRAPWPNYSNRSGDGVAVRWCNTRVPAPSPAPGVKTLNRLENVIARMEWNDPSISEGLMCDHTDLVIEGTMSNLFCVVGNTLITPDLGRCGVAGVQRDRIIALAAKQRIPFVVKSLHRNELMRCDELFVCNSIIGIWPVIALDAHHWNVGAITREIQRSLEQNEDDV